MRLARLRHLIIGFLVFLFALPTFVTFYTDYLWFRSLGFVSVFMTILTTRIGVFSAVFIGAGIFIYANYRWAVDNTGGDRSMLATGGIVLLSGILAGIASGYWETVLRFFNQVPFGLSEPLTGLDAAFFVYTLPFASLVLNVASVMVLFAAGIVAWTYVSKWGLQEYNDVMETFMGMQDVSGTELDIFNVIEHLRTDARRHIMALMGAGAVLTGGWLVFMRYGLFLSQQGAVFGVGYTRSLVTMPLYTILAAGCLLVAVAAVTSLFLNTERLTLGVAGLTVVVAVAGFAGAAGVQTFVVEPDEFNKERPYLENQIDMTRKGFGLDRIESQSFTPSPNLTREQIENNPGTMENIRLWDYRPLRQTYNEMQIFRTYYQFNDVDIDRYEVDGQEKQVMLSAREIDMASLPEQSRSWVNRHLVYTHGFGIAMSPVDKVSEEGFPEYYVKNIPPSSSIDLNVTQPRIYYGESTHQYAITNTGTRELDYPSGDNNVYTRYAGDGGVQLDSMLKRLAFAWRFGDLQILFSGSIEEQSRLQFKRTIQERVRAVTPFLTFDDDPYITVTDDGLKWVYDAYTSTDQFPYADKQRFKGKDINYVRNAVKVVVDAYSGDMTYYIADENDSMVQTYEEMFPVLFEPMEEMPADLQDNIRYPEDLFTAQTRAHFDYHMTNPKVFYNREDQWRAPMETLRGSRSEIEPYYVMMSLPDSNRTEFMMIQPFIPEERENLIGWIGARSDPPNYGTMKAYTFPKQELVFGPAQVDARIDQDTEISQRMTLWSQQGSSVFRGNLLAIPLDDTLLYVEPLYLVSGGSGAVPQLRRVIVAHNDRLTMQPTLDNSLDVLFGDAAAEGPVVVSPGALEEARSVYNDAQTALQNGDFATYAERIEELGSLLNQEDSAGSTINQTMPMN
ncbi:MAG: UPF0182 family protein [Candidatus Nanohaloarchaeota archaeon QJJ-5]|nr:UPF0182 family protein [Candidatus Nanohaloarchaeota archaeon QJJ-5]